MPKKKRSRRLWLQIKFKVPKGVSPQRVAKTLLESVERGDYEYPESWSVAISWRNKLFAKMKTDEFTNAMEESADSSYGWDFAVIDYLERKIKR